MKLTRGQLRRIISESVSSILNESSAFESFRSGPGGQPDGGHFEPHSQYPEAIQLHWKGKEYGQAAPGSKQEKADSQSETGYFASNVVVKNVMSSISKALKKDLSKKDYFIWSGLDDFWSDGLQRIEAMGGGGDPYLYMGEGDPMKDGTYRKLRVAAGPNPRAIGKVFSNIEKSRSLAKSSMVSMVQVGNSSAPGRPDSV